jgi:hypothetical protein
MSRRCPSGHSRCLEGHLGDVERPEGHLRDIATVLKGTFETLNRAPATGQPRKHTSVGLRPRPRWRRMRFLAVARMGSGAARPKPAKRGSRDTCGPECRERRVASIGDAVKGALPALNAGNAPFAAPGMPLTRLSQHRTGLRKPPRSATAPRTPAWRRGPSKLGKSPRREGGSPDPLAGSVVVAGIRVGRRQPARKGLSSGWRRLAGQGLRSNPAKPDAEGARP